MPSSSLPATIRAGQNARPGRPTRLLSGPDGSPPSKPRSSRI
jgi:hypothetical protein